MGTDIRISIEAKLGDTNIWSPINYGTFFLENYTMYTLMAGVEAEYENVAPLFYPRGLPSDISPATQLRNELCVAPDGAATGDFSINRSFAEKYVAAGQSIWRDSAHTCITNPNFHHHSFLTTEEFELCIKAYMKHRKNDIDAFLSVYRATLAFMKSLEHDGRKARIIFWFC